MFVDIGGAYQTNSLDAAWVETPVISGDCPTNVNENTCVNLVAVGGVTNAVPGDVLFAGAEPGRYVATAQPGIYDLVYSDKDGLPHTELIELVEGRRTGPSFADDKIATGVDNTGVEPRQGLLAGGLRAYDESVYVVCSRYFNETHGHDYDHFTTPRFDLVAARGTDAEREAVYAKARRNGATVLWLYAAGYANPEGTVRLSATNVAETVGFPMGLIDKTFFPQFRVEDNTKRFVKGANRARSYGDLGRPVEEGPAIRLAPQRYVNPGFFVNDPEATVLGRYQDGRVAMAAKRVGGFTSVYCGSLVLESDLLRRVAEGAGCHLYLRTDDVLYANGDFVAVHADGDGRRKVRFREKCSPYEVYENRSYGTEVDEIEVDMRNGQTLMWRLD